MTNSAMPYEPAAIVFDVETHDKTSPRIVEAAYGYVNSIGILDRCSIRVALFNPGVPISYGAMAVHHITDEDVRDCPSSSTFALPPDVTYVIGHKIHFDLAAIGNPAGIKPIDTLALAQKAWPEQSSHTQTALYYMLHDAQGLDKTKARDFVRQAHSAGVDIQLCSFIFDALLSEFRELRTQLPAILGRPEDGITLLEAMHLISQAALLPLKMPMGKYIGKPPHTVPDDYKDWYQRCEQPDPWLVLSMLAGGATEEGQSQYQLAHAIFGDGPLEQAVHDVSEERPARVPFSFTRR